MFYKSGGIIWKNILKSRKNISAMGLGASKVATLRKLGVFEQNANFKMAYEGYTAIRQFYFWNSVSSLFRAPICQIMSFGAPHSTLQHYFAEKRPL